MAKRTGWGLLAALLAVDALAALAALHLVFSLAPLTGVPPLPPAPPRLLLAAVLPLWIALFAANRLYVLDELFEGSVEYARVAHACTLAVLSLIIMGFWGRALRVIAPSREMVLLLWGSGVAMAEAGRFLTRRIVRLLRRRGHLTTRVVIAGLGAQGTHLARHYRELPAAGVQVVGFVDDFAPPGTPVVEGLRVLGTPSALPRVLRETGASEVIVLPNALAWESFQDLVRSASQSNGYALRLATEFREIVTTSVRVHQRGFVPLLTIERARITGLDAVLKMALDIVLTTLLLPLWVTGAGLGAAALLLAGRRPLAADCVLGLEGRPFRMWRLNVRPDGGGLDRILWASGVERLPAMINVLAGRLSLVGLRPVRADQRQRFERWIPNLFTVRPGFTGPWAVYGPAADIDAELRLGAYYIRNYTIWLDLEILARSLARLVWRGRRRRHTITEERADGRDLRVPQLGTGDPQPAEH